MSPIRTSLPLLLPQLTQLLLSVYLYLPSISTFIGFYFVVEMPPSSGQSRNRNDLSELQSSRIADLTRRLENAATSTGAQQSVRLDSSQFNWLDLCQLTQCSFPIRFIEALLRTVTPVDSSNLIEIIPIIDQNKGKLIQVLHTNSSRCLAYLLLSSSASSDQDCGLHFLLARYPLLILKNTSNAN